MPRSEAVRLDVAGIRLAEAPGGLPVTLGDIGGGQLLVLLAHRP